MTTTLEEEYPEGAQYIRQAVAEHGEAWVLENYITDALDQIAYRARSLNSQQLCPFAAI